MPDSNLPRLCYICGSMPTRQSGSDCNRCHNDKEKLRRAAMPKKPRKPTKRDFVLRTLANLPPGDECTTWPYPSDIISTEHGAQHLGVYVYFTLLHPEERGLGKAGHLCGNETCFRPSHFYLLENRYQYLLDALANQPTDDSCMEWPYGKTDNTPGVEYGTVRKPDGSKDRAHRIAYELTNGPIPDGLCICHQCDNPPCFRPAHLFLGDHQANIDDMYSKGRQRHAENPGRGPTHTSSLFTWDDVDVIRASFANGFSLRQLAKQWECSDACIAKVVKRISYKDEWRGL